MRISDWSSDVCSSDLYEFKPVLFCMLFQVVGNPPIQLFIFGSLFLCERSARVLVVAGEFVLLTGETFLRTLPVGGAHSRRFLLIISYLPLERIAARLQVGLRLLRFFF